jgi:anti-sigma-K factor RskA
MSDELTPGGDSEPFADTEALLRQVTADDQTLTLPPADLWSAIEAEALGNAPTSETAPLAPVIDLADRRRRRTMVTLAAAAAAVVAVVGVVSVTGGDSLGPEVAAADLDYDPVAFDSLGADADALVSLHDADGTFRLSVDESDLPDVDTETADLELWLIQPDADGNPADLVSLGLIDPSDPGTFDVPEGFDPDVFFVVDISVEPRDGNASHSGRSILRGALTKA